LETEKERTLFRAALRSRENSYSPYSKFKVGAAILTESGNIYSGCNVENCSFGATICAERTAILKAVSEEGKIKIKKVVVVTEPQAEPCGMCLQVIAEFACKECVILLCDSKNILKRMSFQDFLPNPFNPSKLP
jgi:cytidine deaminase